MQKRFSLFLAALLVCILAPSPPTLRTARAPTPRPPVPVPASVVPLPPVQAPSPTLARMELRLDDLVYELGDSVTATLDLGRRALKDGVPPAVLLTSPDSGDVEILTMEPSATADRFQGSGPVPTTPFFESDAVQPYDGTLTLMPGEIFHAIWLVDGLAQTDSTEEPLLSDFGVANDPAAVAELPMDIVPELAQWFSAPPMAKPFGTLVSHSGATLQVALNEMMVAPRSRHELDAVLERTGGRIVLTDLLPEERGQREPRYYLIEVDTTSADVSALPTLRRMRGQTGLVAADSDQVLRMLALTTELRMEGYPVGVNPRLRYAAAPLLSAVEQSNLLNSMRSFGPMNVPALWAYLALWDKDEVRVPAAILDMGFAPNRDFRDPLVQCDMEAGTLAEGFACGPGIAVGPPTVGNSFFGSFSWHGNGVVTTAGGVVNNGWGAAGVGGQVVQPMLYRYGLASYAFEMGLGIRKATLDGAAVINLSASYPCTILTEFDIGISYCQPGERFVLCSLVSAGLAAAVETVCGTIPFLQQVPVVGPVLAAAVVEVCNAGRTVVAIAATACYGTLLLGDLKGNLEEAVAFATEQGVPVVNSAGNELSRSSLPGFLQDLINVDNTVADDWDQIPGVIPQVISAGAVASSWPFANVHFHGPSVDLWAPISSRYFAPPTTDVVTGSDQQVARSIGGTSAAAPYITGLIACMQAVNPELNPRTPGLTPTQRAAIVPRITALLKENAWSNAELVALAPGGFGPLVDAAGAERGNMIHPLRTIQAAAVGVLPDVGAMGYDTLLDTDEVTPSLSADTEPFAHPIALGGIFSGAIVTIRGEEGAADLQDVDWFRYTVPAGPDAFYTARFKLTVPRAFGALTTDTAGYQIEPSAAQSTPDEDVYLIAGPALPAGGEGAFRIAPVLDSDNVYKVEYVAAEPTQIRMLPFGNPLPRSRGGSGHSLAFQWPASGDFRAVFYWAGNEAFTATLRTAGGKVIQQLSVPPHRAALRMASIDLTKLDAGDYRIEFSHPAQAFLPDAATGDDAISLEMAAVGPRVTPPRLGVDRRDGEPIAAWPSGALRYRLEYTEDPMAGPWIPIAGEHTRRGGEYHCTLPRTGTARVYRLREIP